MIKYQIEFKNIHFFISDNTLLAFIRLLKTIDEDLIYNSNKSGNLKNIRIIYIKSNLSLFEINRLSFQFIQKYEHLTIYIKTVK